MDVGRIIEESIQVFALKRTEGKRIRQYKGFYVSRATIAKQGDQGA
jgi:hypothetical protein